MNGILRLLTLESDTPEIKALRDSLLAIQDEGESQDGKDASQERRSPAGKKRKPFLKYTLRVNLRGIKPPIYRKFEVPSNVSLATLSELIIRLMGWDNSHLNCFQAGGETYSPSSQIDKGGFSYFDELPQEDYVLSDVLNEKGRHIIFEYDFGDRWEHEVRLSSVAQYAEDESPQIRFVKGARACPPEDCGGIWGYMDLLEMLERKKAGKRLSAD